MFVGFSGLQLPLENTLNCKRDLLPPILGVLKYFANSSYYPCVSLETPLYRKSEVFYGLHKTRDSIRKFGTAVLVEGYTDFLQLVQLGVPNVVALSGTALADKHAAQIRKFASKVYLAYDGDDAGINATLRAGYVLLKAGVEPLIIAVPPNQDPDNWVRDEGIGPFQEAMGCLLYTSPSPRD